jgi:hypothetical protein
MENVLLWSPKLPKQIENMINRQVAASPLWFFLARHAFQQM